MQEMERDSGTTNDLSGDESTPFTEPSLIDLIKDEVRETGEVEDVYIPIGLAYTSSGLAVRYHMPESGKEIDNISNKVFREYKDRYSRNLYTSIDVMIHLCAGLYVKPVGYDEYIELDPEMSGEPVRFDQRLANTLGFAENMTARSVVKRMFGNNDLAIMDHSAKLSRWLQNTNADISVGMWEAMGE